MKKSQEISPKMRVLTNLERQNVILRSIVAFLLRILDSLIAFEAK